MVLIKTEKCENALEARSKEREYKEQLNATLNGNVPSRTREQYRIDTKEEKKETDKKYYENNKDAICKRQTKYRKDNPEKVKDLDKQAYQRKKATRQRPYECECGCICKFSSRLAHFKTAKHQQYLQSQTNPQE